MNSAELFTHAVTSLPEVIRQRLDGDSPLDWRTLEDPETALRIADASRAHRRLPESVETLVERLVEDVGIAPADVIVGIEREGAAPAWRQRVAFEPDGGGYRMRNRHTGEIHLGVRSEAVAGYAMLALDLATAVHEACEHWIEAGDRYLPAAAGESNPVARCAIGMSARLKSPSAPLSTSSLAGILEDAWNSQSAEVRAELCTEIRLSTARGARAPRRCYFAPINGYRVRAFDLGEVRWLRALAERAGAEQRSDILEDVGDLGASPDSDPDELALGRELAELQRTANRLLDAPDATPQAKIAAGSGSSDEAASLDMTALEVQIRAESMGALVLGSNPDDLTVEDELASLKRAAHRLPGTVRRRLGASYGIGVTQALARLQDPKEADAVYAELRAAISARHAPPMLEDLASSLLIDTGVQTREGLRTGSARLDPAEGQDGGYQATEVETGMHGHLTPQGVVEQLHLGLTFGCDAWAGLTMLENAGKEGGWTLGETSGGNAKLTEGELETLEAAQQIEHALERIRVVYARADRSPSALGQASMAAAALTTVGPTVRAAAGWPGAAEAPNPRFPEDVARVAAVAEALLGSIKSISNRLIAGRMAGSRREDEKQET